MTRTIIALAILLATSTAVAAPAVGDQVIYRSATDEYRTGFVSRVVSGTTIDLVALGNANDWADGNSYAWVVRYSSITPGPSIGQYTIGTAVQDMIAAYDGFLVPPSGLAPSLTLGGSGVQLSATRPVWLSIRGTASMTSTLTGGQGYTVELRCDSGSTPTTVVDDATGSITQTLGLSVTLAVVQPVRLSQLVQPGDYCRIVQSVGAASVTLIGVTAKAL